MARVCILVNDCYVYVSSDRFTCQSITEAMSMLPVILGRCKTSDQIRVELELKSGRRWEARFFCPGD